MQRHNWRNELQVGCEQSTCVWDGWSHQHGLVERSELNWWKSTSFWLNILPWSIISINNFFILYTEWSFSFFGFSNLDSTNTIWNKLRLFMCTICILSYNSLLKLTTVVLRRCAFDFYISIFWTYYWIGYLPYISWYHDTIDVFDLKMFFIIEIRYGQ